MKISIRNKLILIYTVIVVIVFSGVNIITASLLNQSNKETVSADILSYRDTVLMYIGRFSSDDSEDYFNDSAYSIGEEIYLATGRHIAIFNAEGSPLYASIQYMLSSDHDDLNLALQGNEAYVITSSTDSVYVYHTFPILFEDTTVGYVRTCSDFTELYHTSDKISHMILIATLGVLIISFMLLMIFMHNVLSPINKLTEAIQHTSKDPEHSKTILIDRDDEIGKLSKEYNKMALTIEHQIDTIQNERDILKRTLKYKKEFMDNVTHELKTPLTVIKGYAELMQDNPEDTELHSMGLSHIINESDRLHDMVVNILEVSRDPSLRPEEFESIDAMSIMDSVVQSMNIKAHRYGSNIEYTHCGECFVSGVEEKLKQAFINLLDNAIKYGTPQKTISVTLNRFEDIVSIAVSNHTLNLTAQDMESIFEPLYYKEQKQERGSIGLGLAICSGIIKAHNGTLNAELDEHEKKVTFTITLPGIHGGHDA